MRISFLPLVLLLFTAGAMAVPPAPDTDPPKSEIKETKPVKSLFQDTDPVKEIVLKMGIESGRENDHGRDSRVFTIPVTCGDAKTNFTWGCGGQTIISAGFATKARVEIHPNDDLKAIVDGEGKPLFLGDASVELILGGKSVAITAWIMRDGTFNKNVPGVIGYEVAKQFQWEIDPRVPQITLRPLGTLPKGKVLATLPLKDEQDNLWIHVKVRGAEDDVTIMPQTPDFQASPALQKSWDTDAGGKEPDDIKTILGNVRVMSMHDKDGIWLTGDLFETNFLAYLLSDNPDSRNGIGQSILNRFVYSVDISKKEMVLIERVKK